MASEQIKRIFEQFMASYWNDITEFCPFVGAFIIDHNSREAYVDDNCKKMLSIEVGNCYDILSERINGIEARLINDVELKKLISSSIMTLGIIKKKNISASLSSADAVAPDLLDRFRRLIDQNLFQYHYQPIIDAHTGDIIAYEALMRTDSSINMNPLEILDVATKTGELYKIEQATMHNNMQFLLTNKDLFTDKKLFINAISAYILSDEDWAELERNYKGILSNIVIELTEQTEITDADLDHIHDRLRRNKINIAIDDYGTGYSNTTNLMRYKPKYVKIDRALISEIDTKPNIQKLVGGLIDFLQVNGVSTLAEGVETLDEMRTCIKLGVDLIQGYYVSKPKPFIMSDVAESTKNEVSLINLQYSSEIAKVYHTTENETISLHKLADMRYNIVFVESEKITVEGKPGEFANIQFIIKDSIDAHMRWINVGLISDKDDPLVSLGQNSSLHLSIEGANDIKGKGIYVPATTLFELLGPGSLKITAEKTTCFGIGVEKGNSHGTILLNLAGSLDLEANGDDVVAIGGGKNALGKSISINSGYICIHSSGNNCIAIGTYDGDSVIDISNCHLNIEISASTCTAIGSLYGSATVDISNFLLEILLQGINLCGIGIRKKGSGFINTRDGKINMTLRGREISGIGSNGGDLKITSTRCLIGMRCEGNYATALGDIECAGSLKLYTCDLCMSLSSTNSQLFGVSPENLVIDNCNDYTKVNID